MFSLTQVPKLLTRRGKQCSGSAGKSGATEPRLSPVWEWQRQDFLSADTRRFFSDYTAEEINQPKQRLALFQGETGVMWIRANRGHTFAAVAESETLCQAVPSSPPTFSPDLGPLFGFTPPDAAPHNCDSWHPPFCIHIKCGLAHCDKASPAKEQFTLDGDSHADVHRGFVGNEFSEERIFFMTRFADGIANGFSFLDFVQPPVKTASTKCS